MPPIKSNNYSIEIGMDAFDHLNAFLKKNPYSAYFILCDENTLQHCLPLLVTSCPKLIEAHIIEIESGEASKSINVCIHLWQTLMEHELDKNALIINLGGGVVSDLGGFCASVYKRGISFINVPTSFLAMADASVGGKTGVDFNNVKNALGTFAHPKAVFVNPIFLNTLPKRHYRNGLAEIYKIALVSNDSLWKTLKSNEKKNAQYLIRRSVTLKNKIVLKDPFDKGLRKILNFGHTIGHAVEASYLNTANELLHGEAILIGMIIESHLALQKKLLSETNFLEIISQLELELDFLRPTNLKLDLILPKIINDKKNSNKKLLFSLIDKIGSCQINIQINQKQIEKSLEFYNSIK